MLFQYCYIKRDNENYLSIQLQDIENQRDVIIDNLYAKEDLLKQYEIYYNSLEKILNSFSDIISVIAIFLWYYVEWEGYYMVFHGWK